MQFDLTLLKSDSIVFLQRDPFFKEEFFVKNIEDLKKFSFLLSSAISKNSFLAINGEMGSGKTTLVRFLSSYIGVEEKISSPTFNIVKSYWSDKHNCFLNHFDFFRFLGNSDSLLFEEIKEGNINIAEWADIAPYFWINEKILIYLKIVDISNFEKAFYVTFFK